MDRNQESSLARTSVNKFETQTHSWVITLRHEEVLVARCDTRRTASKICYEKEVLDCTSICRLLMSFTTSSQPIVLRVVGWFINHSKETFPYWWHEYFEKYARVLPQKLSEIRTRRINYGSYVELCRKDVFRKMINSATTCRLASNNPSVWFQVQQRQIFKREKPQVNWSKNV